MQETKEDRSRAGCRLERVAAMLDGTATAMGFGCCRAWIVLSISFSVERMSDGTNWAFLLAGAAAGFFAAALASRSRAFPAAAVRRAAAVLAIASSALVPASAAAASPQLLAAGIVAGGLGAGLMQVCWGHAFSDRGRAFSLVCAPAAAIVTGAVVASACPRQSVAVMAVLPLASLCLLEIRTQAVGWGSADEGACAKGNPAPSARDWLYRAACDWGGGLRLMVSICLFSFLVRMFDALPAEGGDPFSWIGGSGAFALLSVGAIFLAIARFAPRASLLAYRLSCPIMAVGMVAFAFAFDIHSALSVVVLSVGYELFDLLAWVLFAEYAREGGRVSYAVFGAGTGFMLLGMGAGYAVGQQAAESGVAASALGMTYMVLASMALLFVAAFLIVPESVLRPPREADRIAAGLGSFRCAGESTEAPARSIDACRKGEEPVSGGGDPDRLQEEPPPMPPVSGGLSLSEACALIAADYRLTPREREVLVLLARGRTLPIVSRDLHITKNTARSHIERVYQKTGIHKQQDLIDLVERRQKGSVRRTEQS